MKKQIKKTKKAKTKKRKHIEKTKAIQTIKSYDISKPEQISRMANVVKGYVIKNNLSVRIVDRDYVMVEGWQFAGGLMGLFPRVVKVESIGNMKWLAQVDIINRRNGSVEGSGFALCSKDESKKRSFDEYAILSMAQTRAIGKAYRNLIGWVMKLAGYEGTPAEEIKGKVVEVATENPGPKVKDLSASEADKERIKTLAKELGCNTIGQIEKKTGLRIDWKNMTKVQSTRVLAELLQKKIAKK